MYMYSVSEKHLSNPSVSCPLISKQPVNHNSIPENIHSKRSAQVYVNSRHSEISIFCDNNQKTNDHIVRNIFTKLRSTSSEEFQALLNMSSESCKIIPDRTNFYSYYSQVLLQKELQNSKTCPNYKQRNVACLCKPVKEIDIAKEEETIDHHKIKNKCCPCKPRYSIDNSEEKKGGMKIDEKNMSSEERGSTKQIRVCLPLDPDDFGENCQEKGLKLVIYGDKKSCDCKRPDVEVAMEEKPSYECLACTISKNPQFKNILTGLANGDKKKNKKNGFSTKLSNFPFFKKKHKNTQVQQCSDKGEQTCSSRKSEIMVNKACSCSMVNKACSCSSSSEPINEKTRACRCCTCKKCGKVDLQKFMSASPACNCCGDDTWKMVMKMESKQNYRQIKNILKEMTDQRQEIRDLNRRYTSLLKFQISSKGSGGEHSDKQKEYYSTARRNQLDYGTEPANHLNVKDIKQIKDAINQSTIDRQNKPEKATQDDNTDEKRNSTNPSESSFYTENNKDSERNDVKIEEKPKSLSDVKELTNNDSCICLVDKIRKTSNKCVSFWKKLCGKKNEVCLKQCECSNTKPLEKYRNLFREKINGAYTSGMDMCMLLKSLFFSILSIHLKSLAKEIDFRRSKCIGD